MCFRLFDGRVLVAIVIMSISNLFLVLESLKVRHMHPSRRFLV